MTGNVRIREGITLGVQLPSGFLHDRVQIRELPVPFRGLVGFRQLTVASRVLCGFHCCSPISNPWPGYHFV